MRNVKCWCQRFFVAALSIWSLSCDLPRDARGTLSRVQNGTLRVGLIEHAPWVRHAGDEPSGVEVDLVRQFAADLNAQPEWYWGNGQDHMEAIERFELDLVIGGLTDDTPWQKKVGLTHSYFTDRLKIGAPPGGTSPSKLEGLVVAVQKGEVSAAYVEAENAVVERVENPSQASKLAAASEWRLEHWGFTLTDIELHKDEHVMAVPPGENGWLKRLDEFLFRRKSTVKELLKQQEVSR